MRTFTSWPTWREAEAGLTGRLPPETVEAVRAAVAFAADRHGGQRRPTGVPYLEHLLEALEVAVAGAGVTGREVLTAIILHDVVEDTPTTIAEVADRHGDRVAELVGLVTKPPSPADPAAKAAAKRAYLRSLAAAPREAVLVKLADRVSNVQELHRMPAAFRRRYHRETLGHVLPLAEGEPWFRAWFAGWREVWRHLEPAP
ncbi:HD domain-containing protein [Spongiactinospora sp. TRM90649]|uniref:HD domain-containing protein n=1 Tax=Spongiactinospora sp. TRM90649 TaxID=3031114 RepID=UPI0023F8EE38|nr:HD domain-containing protein [Spongiactinospora sp. TRM90649]MDF5755989.1 HD domain-containing protein [Spongiactinospora sp. TRM90649]